jgi:hypothetical protein
MAIEVRGFIPKSIIRGCFAAYLRSAQAKKAQDDQDDDHEADDIHDPVHCIPICSGEWPKATDIAEHKPSQFRAN